jgi:hypothetical protein
MIRLRQPLNVSYGKRSYFYHGSVFILALIMFIWVYMYDILDDEGFTV